MKTYYVEGKSSNGESLGVFSSPGNNEEDAVGRISQRLLALKHMNFKVSVLNEAEGKERFEAQDQKATQSPAPKAEKPAKPAKPAKGNAVPGAKGKGKGKKVSAPAAPTSGQSGENSDEPGKDSVGNGAGQLQAAAKAAA